jgi:cell cycle serine/threonine-protein kinase CDC5/MSD2
LKEKRDTSPAIDVWAIGLMFYAMLYGHLPFWGDTEEQFVDKIINSPLKFQTDIPVTSECKEIIRGML